MRTKKQIISVIWLLLAALVAGGCSDQPWNSPYPAEQAGKNILYTSFAERPKHLDPARSYSANEYAIIGQIYEPPLQYHFLKRPYELEPLTASAMPEVRYLDAQGNRLPDDVDNGAVAYSVYRIHIQPGIQFQPHPALARDEQGDYRYHDLTAEQMEAVYKLADFKHRGTRELTADDYVYQIKRLASPLIHSPILGLMSEYIVGLEDLAKRTRADLAAQRKAGEESGFFDLRDYELEGVKAVDRYTYEIKINGRYPQLRYWLAMPFFSPMPWEADRFYGQPGMKEKNITLDWFPIGTGAFMLTVNNPNLQMVMERNPNYHGATYPSEGEPGDREAGYLDDAGKPLPFIDKVISSLEKETIPRWNKFLQGYYDNSGISSESFDQAVQVGGGGEVQLTDDMREKGIKLSTAVEASTFYLGFNMLDDTIGGYSERARKLRQAISIAVNYEEYISIFANGRGIPAQGPIPPGIFGHQKGREGINPYVYDWRNGEAVRKPIDEARRLLAEAGYPNGVDRETGKPLALHFDVTGSGPDSKSLFNWFRKQFEKLNIQLVVRNTMYNRFQEKMRKGTAQIFLWGWNADYPDPENFLFLLYGPNSKTEHNGENAANYNNPEFDALFERVKNMENGPQRLDLIEQMVHIARRDAPWVWGMHPKSFTLYHSWYHNAKPNLMAQNTLQYKRIDPQLRQEKRKAWNQPVVWPIVVVILLLVVVTVPAFITYRRKEHMAPKGKR